MKYEKVMKIFKVKKEVNILMTLHCMILETIETNGISSDLSRSYCLFDNFPQFRLSFLGRYLDCYQGASYLLVPALLGGISDVSSHSFTS